MIHPRRSDLRSPDVRSQHESGTASGIGSGIFLRFLHAGTAGLKVTDAYSLRRSAVQVSALPPRSAENGSRFEFAAREWSGRYQDLLLHSRSMAAEPKCRLPLQSRPD